MSDRDGHCREKADLGDWQTLKDHLQGVAKLARQFAERARPNDEAVAQAAEVAGLLHYLGKYRRECCVAHLNLPQLCGAITRTFGRFHWWSHGIGESEPFCRAGKS